jgi:membrane fusion protein, multidrug efflux system
MANVVTFSRAPWKEAKPPELHESPKKPKRSFRVKRYFYFLPLVLGIALAGGLFYYWEVYLQYVVQTDNAQVEASVVPVNSRIMGFVEHVKVKENDRVEKEMVLAEFDSSDTQLELRLKEARYQKAAADFERAKKLHRTGALSKAELELSEAAATLASADLDGSKLKLSFTKVKAHVSGIVGKRSLQPGQFVQPGQSLFWIIPDSENVRIRANLKETQIRSVQPGQKVLVRLDAFPKQTFIGRVESILPASGSLFSLFPPENSSGHYTKVVQTIPVFITLDDPPQSGVVPGMSAYVEIDTRRGIASE